MAWTDALLGTLFTWGVTALGAALVFVIPENQAAETERKMLDISYGFAGGVMLAASFWSLLVSQAAFYSAFRSLLTLSLHRFARHLLCTVLLFVALSKFQSVVRHSGWCILYIWFPGFVCACDRLLHLKWPRATLASVKS